ncbi:MAG: HD-GYP domain-containing protein [Treponema sp.]|nr:HD-GYP domain-containing protein [Candidatus Treponema equi]
MISKKNRANFIILTIALVVLILCYFFVFLRNIKFNKTENRLSLSELDETSPVSVSIYERGGASDSWETALSELVSSEVGLPKLRGVTFDAVIENKGQWEIRDWKLVLSVTKNCFIESAWCGQVEICQNNDGKKVSQKMNLRNIDIDVIDVSYINNGNQIFFPLRTGDTLTYHPSVEEKEAPLIAGPPDKSSSFARVGFIMYHDPEYEEFGFSEGFITFHRRRSFSHDPAFNVLVFVTIIWFLCFLFLLITESRITDMEQIELRERKTIQEVMETFSGFVDAKDPYTGGHSIRVGRYSRQLAEEMGLDEKKCRLVFYCGLLHDCGKISIHDDILSKPKRLTDEEFAVIKSHTTRGFEILSGLTAIPEACMVARYHHERYDGKGYPDRLAGEAIPLFARITCLADAFDAMNSNRCYRGHMTPDMIIKQITENSGKQFDPRVAEAMLRLLMRSEIKFADS